jgi:ClpP class serine protease
VVKTLTLELVRDLWLMHEASLEAYSAIALDYLSGKTIPQGLFGELQLPNVPDSVAMIVMAGPLTKSDICGSQGSRSLALQMQAAAANPDIKTILVLAEDCPGGQVSGTQELGNAILAAKEKKPVIGAISGMACSAGIWALACCDEIYALSETDLVGCIGVVARMRNPKKAEAENKDILEVYSDLSPDKNIESRDAQAHKENVLNPIAEAFHKTVIAGRGDRLKLTKENVLSGKTYVASNAAAAGLIDGILPMNRILGRANIIRNKKS